jgi:hypothetical protein
MTEEDYIKDNAEGTAYYDEDLNMSVDHYNKLNELDLIPKEVDEMFEEAWRGLTVDIYSTLREDLRS